VAKRKKILPRGNRRKIKRCDECDVPVSLPHAPGCANVLRNCKFRNRAKRRAAGVED